MGRIRRLVLKTYYEVSKGNRKCWRENTIKIKKGNRCMVVEDGGYKNNYCMKCAPMLLKKAKRDIAALEAKL